MSIHPVTLYVIKCDQCGEQYDDGAAFWDPSHGLEGCEDDEFWLITESKHICYRCIKCEVCGKQGYAIDDHGVCEDHEDHDFSEATDVDR